MGACPQKKAPQPLDRHENLGHDPGFRPPTGSIAPGYITRTARGEGQTDCPVLECARHGPHLGSTSALDCTGRQAPTGGSRRPRSPGGLRNAERSAPDATLHRRSAHSGRMAYPTAHTRCVDPTLRCAYAASGGSYARGWSLKMAGSSKLIPGQLCKHLRVSCRPLPVGAHAEYDRINMATMELK